jgi:hypothetical protein
VKAFFNIDILERKREREREKAQEFEDFPDKEEVNSKKHILTKPSLAVLYPG